MPPQRVKNEVRDPRPAGEIVRGQGQPATLDEGERRHLTVDRQLRAVTGAEVHPPRADEDDRRERRGEAAQTIRRRRVSRTA